MRKLILTMGLAALLAACAGADVTSDKHPRVGAGLTADRVGGR